MIKNEFDKDINKILNEILRPNLINLDRHFHMMQVTQFEFSKELADELNNKYGLKEITYIVEPCLYLGRAPMQFKYKDKKVIISNKDETKSMLDYLKECIKKDTNEV